MTIGVGLLTSRGLVLCADSQETEADYKSPVQKIVPHSDAWTEIAIAGSGIGPLVDMAAYRITQACLGGFDSYGAIEEKITEVLNGLYAREFDLFPHESPYDIHVELLIAVKIKKTWSPSSLLFFGHRTSSSQ